MRSGWKAGGLRVRWRRPFDPLEPRMEPSLRQHVQADAGRLRVVEDSMLRADGRASRERLPSGRQ